MKRLFHAVLLALALALGAAPAARAQVTPPPPVVFTAVDAFSYDGTACKFTVTGVVQGDSAASDRAFVTGACSTTTVNPELERRTKSCERMALLAMSKPGQFLFQVAPMSTTLLGNACKLSRVNP